MSAVTEMAVEKGLELLTTAASLATNEAPKVLGEYLNLMIFEAAIGLTPILLVLVIVYYGNKVITFGLDTTMKEAKELDAIVEAERAKKGAVVYTEARSRLSRLLEEEFNLKTYRFFLMAGALSISLWLGYDNVKRIGKLVIAPRVFLIQEGASLLKKGESSVKR